MPPPLRLVSTCPVCIPTVVSRGYVFLIPLPFPLSHSALISIIHTVYTYPCYNRLEYYFTIQYVCLHIYDERENYGLWGNLSREMNLQNGRSRYLQNGRSRSHTLDTTLVRTDTSLNKLRSNKNSEGGNAPLYTVQYTSRWNGAYWLVRGVYLCLGSQLYFGFHRPSIGERTRASSV